MERNPDPYGALVAPLDLEGAADGPLAGLTFVAKDVFAVQGRVAGAGSPEWAATHAAAPWHASAVARLLGAGARLVGVAVTDELAFSLTGVESRDGAPVNPAAPDRLPGGSSSGPAVAVASELCGLALGTDTAGSIRLPAAYCGVCGFRPTHGRIALDGAVPLAPSFDTAGLLARSADVLGRSAAALLDGAASAWRPRELLIAADAFASADPSITLALGPSLTRVATALGGRRHDVVLAPGPDSLPARASAFRDLQGWEAWRAHGAWLREVEPALGPGVAARFAYAATVSEAQRSAAAAVRDDVAAEVRELLGRGGVLALPAAADPAPRRDLPSERLNELRARSLTLLATAGLAGAPVVVLPAGRIGGGPVGLALMGPPGGDEALLALAAAVAQS